MKYGTIKKLSHRTSTMICVAAAIVFGVLALFSAKYRALAKEAWSCVFRKMTLRACQSGLDRRVRMSATLTFGKRWPAFGRFVYKVFPALSFLFVLLTILSFGYMVWGGYNFAMYGNCNGPGSTGFCVFDPNGVGSSDTGQCTESARSPSMLIAPSEADLTGMKTIHPQGTSTVIFFGCYACPYTREASDALFAAIAKRPDVRFVLVDFPLQQHANSTLAANAGNCVYDQSVDAYLAYAPLVYAADLTRGVPESTSLTAQALAACVASDHARVTAGVTVGTRAGLYGTPTYFIGGKAYVGPLNERALLKLIDAAAKQ